MEPLLSHLRVNKAFKPIGCTSVERLAIFSARRLPDIVNAFGLFPFCANPPFFLAFFLSAFVPE
jgi:hypothetical protein